MNIISGLGLDKLNDYASLPGGIRALHRPDIARLAYDVKIISSAWDDLDREKNPGFLAGANLNLFETLYQNCNGLHIGRGRFSVFGFLTGNQSVGVPWDIICENMYKETQRPLATLIVGTSRKPTKSNLFKRFYHTIQKEHEIHVTADDDFSVVLRRYFTVESWLGAEVSDALQISDNVD